MRALNLDHYLGLVSHNRCTLNHISQHQNHLGQILIHQLYLKKICKLDIYELVKFTNYQYFQFPNFTLFMIKYELELI